MYGQYMAAIQMYCICIVQWLQVRQSLCTLSIWQGADSRWPLGRDVFPRWDSLLGRAWDQGVANKDQLRQTTKHTGAVKLYRLYQGTSLGSSCTRVGVSAALGNLRAAALRIWAVTSKSWCGDCHCSIRAVHCGQVTVIASRQPSDRPWVEAVPTT